MEMKQNNFRHRCGAVMDIVKVSEFKSILVCVVCGRELNIKIYPTNAKYFADSSLPDLI